eukprot:c9597_g1_i1.p1 GENE.c9597_g1_i1~~c9597_g1_i1.p1  ORF type:complete len:566 (-),score=174.38 c9597_g1_i1:156-1811(-)
MTKAAVLIVDETQAHSTEVAKRGAEIIAAFVGISLTVSNQSSAADSLKQFASLLDENPGHTLPALVFPGEKFAVRGIQTIFRTLARVAPDEGLFGFALHEQTLCDEWFGTAFDFETAIVRFLFASKTSKDGELTKRAREVVLTHLSTINDQLMRSTFLTSHLQPTIADIALHVLVFNSLTKGSAFTELLSSHSRDLAHLNRWAEHLSSLPSFQTATSSHQHMACAHSSCGGVVRSGGAQQAVSEADSLKLGFVHQPLPAAISFVVGAPAPNDKEEYGRPEYVRLGQLQLKQQWIEQRTQVLEARLKEIRNNNGSTSNTAPQVSNSIKCSANASTPSTSPAPTTTTNDAVSRVVAGSRPADSFRGEDPQAYEVARRMTSLCSEHDIHSGRGVVVPKDWYSLSLEQRRDFLGIESTAQLCKSLVLRNTKCKGDRLTDPRNSEYYVVVVQYTARFNSEKMQKFVRELCGKLGKTHFNFQFVDPEVSDQLTGYTHNSVTPLGMREKVPVVLSHEIANLPQNYFVLGGGAEDVKIEMKVSDFIAGVKPFIGDVTYE